MLALPVSAVDIPSVPLTSGGRVAPNVMFILDDSGSMTFVAMPKDIEDYDQWYNGRGWGGTQRGLGDNPTDRSYLNNTIYYNPSTDYVPWMNADGKTRWSGGMDVSAVYYSLVHASGATESIVDKDGSIFYVPKSGITNSTDKKDFDRYQVRTWGGSAKVMRGTGETITLDSANWDNKDINVGDWWRGTFTVPAGTTSLRIRARNGGGGDADLYVRFNAVPTTSSYDYLDNGSGNDETITISNPVAGVWHIGVYNSDTTYSCGRRCTHTAEKVNDEDIDVVASKLDLEEVTPTGRNQDDEMKNIATWYSYHRTRMKTAKAGASEAFAAPSLNKKIRLGYRSINDTSGTIPYASGDGRFYDDSKNGIANRTNWYNSLQKDNYSTGGTPLRGALNTTGDYFTGKEPYRSPKDPSDSSKGYVERFCRQNFSILTTDGYWNDSSPGVSGQDDVSGDSFVNSEGVNVGYVAGLPYQDAAQQNTLADVAMKYWKQDLRKDDDNNVPATDGDPAFWQHMVTFGISIGLKGSLDQSSVTQLLKDGKPKKGGSNVAWPDVTKSDTAKIDDLLHAALNGHGEFIVASNSTEFASGLAAALAAITQRTSSYSNVATNSVSLDAGSKVFNASYVSGLWTGKVVARSVSDVGIGEILWDTSDESNDSIPAFASRKVLTNDGSSLVSFPTSAQTTALDRTTKVEDGKTVTLGPLDYPVTGANNALYIKGDQSKEGTTGGKLRVRTGLLGDIVGSSPAYIVGGSNGDGTKDGTLYVGANDGMLHALDASNGKELFAYVPSILNFDNLRDVSRGDYTHNWFVDGPITISSKKLTTSKNILVGSLGRGGTGLYALDVTDPSSPGFKWALKDTESNNMGLVLGKPILAKIKDGSTKTPAVIFGNGPNSKNNRAILIVRTLDGGSKLAEVDTGEGSASSPNGLTSVTGVYGADGQTLAYVYGGDLLGNVWKFDLTLATPTATKLFAAGTGQPITGGIAIAIHPLTSKRWVLFGTGKFLEDGDIESTATQSMYGFVDDNIATALTPSSLVDSTPASWTTATVDGKTVRAFKEKTSLAANAKGWKVNLPAGERIVQDAQVVSTFLITASMSPTGDACGADGSGYINAVDAFTGTSAGGSYFDLPGDDTMTSGGKKVPIGSVDLGNGMPTLPNLLRSLLVVGGTGGANVSPLKTLKPQWDRVSWREVRSD